MGGPLSGRWGGQPTIEATGSIVLDLSAILASRAGRNTFGLQFSGTRGSPYAITVMVRVESENVGRLQIAHQAFGHLSRPVPAAVYEVELEAVPWQFGGQRWFMLCPRSGRRVCKLYLPNGAHRFASRVSLGLAYQVQRLDRFGKIHARLARSFAKLGARYENPNQTTPAKPKWMRHRTYDRLVGGIETLTGGFDDIFAEKLSHLLAAENQAFVEAMDNDRRRRQ